MRQCLKDNKNCYIHHDPETGDELRCRHYPGLINYGGTCPEAWEEWVKGASENVIGNCEIKGQDKP